MRKIKNEGLNRLSIKEIKNVKKLPAILVLDEVRSAMNVGSVFRTSDAFLIEKIYLCGITAQPPHREINKTALGAQNTVCWEHVNNSSDCMKSLKSQGYQIVAVEQADESTSLTDFSVDASKKYAFIFGNEIFGVTDQIVETADIVLEIPQSGTKHSLNVSVSTGIVLWDYFSKFKRALNNLPFSPNTNI